MDRRVSLMKNIPQCAFIILFIFLIAGSGMASRGGGFYADRQTGVYHADTHDETQFVDETNRVTFDTPEEAEAAGYKPCGICCNPSGKKGN